VTGLCAVQWWGAVTLLRRPRWALPLPMAQLLLWPATAALVLLPVVVFAASHAARCTLAAGMAAVGSHTAMTAAAGAATAATGATTAAGTAWWVTGASAAAAADSALVLMSAGAAMVLQSVQTLCCVLLALPVVPAVMESVAAGVLSVMQARAKGQGQVPRPYKPSWVGHHASSHGPSTTAATGDGAPVTPGAGAPTAVSAPALQAGLQQGHSTGVATAASMILKAPAASDAARHAARAWSRVQGVLRLGWAAAQAALSGLIMQHGLQLLSFGQGFGDVAASATATSAAGEAGRSVTAAAAAGAGEAASKAAWEAAAWVLGAGGVLVLVAWLQLVGAVQQAGASWVDT